MSEPTLGYTAEEMEEMNLTEQQLDIIMCEIEDASEDEQSAFFTSIAGGNTPRFAHMCAFREAPGTRHSDRTFNAERMVTMNNMKPAQLKKYVEIAKSSGISTQGKFYVGPLGRPSDPMAWISTVDEAKSVCREKNLTASGLFEHKGHQVEPKKVRLAKDIRDRLVRARLSSEPALAAKCRSDSRALKGIQAEVVDRHGRACT